MKNYKDRIRQFIKKMSIYTGMFLAPISALAATGSQAPAPPITKVQQLLDLMCAIFGWMFYGLIALSIIMVVVAGFNYVTAGDNAEKVGKANKMILYAAIGIGVALLAKGIPLIVANFLGASGGSIQAC